MKKTLINRDLIRKVPPRFSWVDQRMVTEGFIGNLSDRARSLYLFLVIVADAQGLSYYADKSVCRHLGWDKERAQAEQQEEEEGPSAVKTPLRHLLEARIELCRLNLIAYQAPLYQVLSLNPNQRTAIQSGQQETLALALTRLVKEVPQR